MTNFPQLLAVLDRHRVRYLIVGGVAGIAHGSARLTADLDVVYDRAPDNVANLVDALRPYQPYLRGAPPDLPFRFDPRAFVLTLNFTLTTTLGDIDLLGEITGGGGYTDLLPHTIELPLFDLRVKCLSLSKLIEVKRAAGRPKDFEAIAELESLRDESN